MKNRVIIAMFVIAFVVWVFYEINKTLPGYDSCTDCEDPSSCGNCPNNM